MIQKYALFSIHIFSIFLNSFDIFRFNSKKEYYQFLGKTLILFFKIFSLCNTFLIEKGNIELTVRVQEMQI